MTLNAVERIAARLRPMSAALLLLCAGASPALAHHPFEGVAAVDLSPWQGLISGIGHPLLGLDHLLFLVAIMFLGLRRPGRWVLLLLATGLGGSLLTQVYPLPEFATSVAEAAVSLSLALEGLIALGLVPASLLYPLAALHGYLLGGMIVGAEPTPLLAYGLGLFLAQGSVLLVATCLSRRVGLLLGDQGRRMVALLWIGLGTALAWSAIAG
ncbi:MAG: HupE/UreJ family protein [Synechococcus sp.]